MQIMIILFGFDAFGIFNTFVLLPTHGMIFYRHKYQLDQEKPAV